MVISVVSRRRVDHIGTDKYCKAAMPDTTFTDLCTRIHTFRQGTAPLHTAQLWRVRRCTVRGEGVFAQISALVREPAGSQKRGSGW
jgi:hypothetical protein